MLGMENIYFCYKQTLIFHTRNIVLPGEIEIAKLYCVTECLTDNSSKFSYFSNDIPPWLK